MKTLKDHFNEWLEIDVRNNAKRQLHRKISVIEIIIIIMMEIGLLVAWRHCSTPHTDQYGIIREAAPAAKIYMAFLFIGLLIIIPIAFVVYSRYYTWKSHSLLLVVVSTKIIQG